MENEAHFSHILSMLSLTLSMILSPDSPLPLVKSEKLLESDPQHAGEFFQPGDGRCLDPRSTRLMKSTEHRTALASCFWVRFLDRRRYAIHWPIHQLQRFDLGESEPSSVCTPLVPWVIRKVKWIFPYWSPPLPLHGTGFTADTLASFPDFVFHLLLTVPRKP